MGARLVGAAGLADTVGAWSDGEAVLEGAVRLFGLVSGGALADAWAWEQEVLAWYLELERWAWRRRHPEAPRERWLAEAAAVVARGGARPMTVEALARALGTTRSHYTRGFRRATGLTPAAWLRSERLRLAARLLVAPSEPLKAVAERTGFADAGHLGKAFRRQFGMTPGEYRRQRRGGATGLGPGGPVI